MKPKPYGAQNTKFLEYERSSLIPLTSSELLKFENRTSVIIEISRFSGHRCPGINEGVFGLTQRRRIFLVERSLQSSMGFLFLNKENVLLLVDT